MGARLRGWRRVRAWTWAAAILGLAGCTFGAAPQGGGPGVTAVPGGIGASEPVRDTLPHPPGARLDTIRSTPLDYGKLWTFESLPAAHFQEAHGFAPDSSWLARLRLSTVRLEGCSGAVVSPRGLVLTAHHCVRDALERASEGPEDLLRDGFRAASPEQERVLEGLVVDQLVAVEDVTEELERRLALAPASLQMERRLEIQADIQRRLSEAHGGEGIVVDVIPLYSGARTSAYVYRRRDDVRLAVAPELAVAFFGGDPDNFTYPRYTLDFALLRLYENGAPLESAVHLPWGGEGVAAGASVFSAGLPGASNRFETVAQLELRRDVSDRALLDFLRRRAAIFASFAEERPELMASFGLESALFELQNGAKSLAGQIEALRDPVTLARLRDREARVLDGVVADSALAERFESAFVRMSELQERRRDNAAGYAFVALGSPAYASSTLTRALVAVQYLDALRQALPIRAREALLERFASIADKPAELDEALIQDRLQSFVDAFGAESALARRALQGRSPEGAAAVIRQGSVFADSARAVAALRAGEIPANDPAIAVVEAYLPALGRFEQLRARADFEEAALSEEIARAHLAALGTSVPPDATSSPRVSDGVVQGYPAAGGFVDPFTTFAGMYALHDERAAEPWRLPGLWVERRAALDLSTPLDFASTLDLSGGSSGSPVVDRELRLVGVLFDGNQASLPWSYLYRPERGRAIAVDARAIVAALRDVYGVDALADELSGQGAGAGAAAPRP